MLKLLGDNDAAAAAAASNIMEFETALAKVSRKLEDLRDPQRNYNKMTLDEVRRQRSPSIDWKEHLSAWNLQPDFVVVGQPEFFSGLESLLRKTLLSTLRDYLRFHLVSEYAAFLSVEHRAFTGSSARQIS